MDELQGSEPGRPLAPGAGGANSDLCSRFVDLLPITGASISVLDEAGNQSTICASDDTAAQLEAMQFELGEGPHWEALRTRRPVLVPDLRSAGHSEWPIFSEAVLETGAGALFSLPLSLGAVTIGLVDLYCSVPGNLSTSDLSAALNLAGSVTLPAARMAVQSAGHEKTSESTGEAPELRRDVHQATGMILVQMNVSATEAFLLLKAHAFSSGRTVLEVAQDVVARRLDFGTAAE
ncbi:GAF and ANTAR domain-containing protein [Salinibacterium sp. TMP30]|uniref:GAF and ANTAR domain-containing protein n=1 Tax=Salinibacterium sp. TMP30 TaxID=3138237 RepID=UPI003138C919